MTNTAKFRFLGAAVLAGALLAGCDSMNGPVGEGSVVRTVSPDGRNEIRLQPNRLSVEVLRDGVTVVAPSDIGLTVDGAALGGEKWKRSRAKRSGTVKTPVYKKGSISLDGRESFVDFGDWGVRLVARNDGVAYRFETKRDGAVTVNDEKFNFAFPAGVEKVYACETGSFGCEETVPEARAPEATGKNAKTYLPFVYEAGGKTVAVTESNVHDYPNLYFARGNGGPLASVFSKFPKRTERATGWDINSSVPSGGRWVAIRESEDFLVKTSGSRAFPWRTFVLADAPKGLCEADIVYALADAPAAGSDFSWVKPGKVAWDWWNDWNLEGVDFKAGCNTKSYEYYIDFAARTGVEYVIFDEGWSENLNIWKFHPNVDVPHLIDYASKRGVGIILWMAWAQVYGEEAKVAEHFGKLGAKGFKVDFMDRSDADVVNFEEKFARECAQRGLLVDYHGMTRPTGLQRMYPNIVNFEGIHGLECMKFYHNEDMMGNDVAAFFLRLTAGPMDYTPGAMRNFRVGEYKGNGHTPGSMGTRCRQIAMMSVYEAPLQMLCDAPTQYEKNMECFKYMAAVPVTWDDTVGLGGCPGSMAAVARRKGDVWYAAGFTNREARDYSLDTSFLGKGRWDAEIFRDALDADKNPEKYQHETRIVKAGDLLVFHMAPGGGFSVRFSKK